MDARTQKCTAPRRTHPQLDCCDDRLKVSVVLRCARTYPWAPDGERTVVSESDARAELVVDGGLLAM